MGALGGIAPNVSVGGHSSLSAGRELGLTIAGPRVWAARYQRVKVDYMRKDSVPTITPLFLDLELLPKWSKNGARHGTGDDDALLPDVAELGLTEEEGWEEQDAGDSTESESQEYWRTMKKNSETYKRWFVWQQSLGS